VDAAADVGPLSVGVVSRVLRSRTKAESEVARAEQAVARWQGEAESKRAELAELRASAGATVFADDTGTASRTLAYSALDLQFQIDGAEAATVVAEQQLHEARQELVMAQAAEKRDQAARLSAEAEVLQGKVDDLLRQLTALDGATYVPEPELGLAEREAVMIQHGRYVLPVVPRADVLREEAGALLAEVAAMERPVLEERRTREAALRSLVPSAQIDVPAWDDIDSDTIISCRVSEGTGSARFEIGRDESFRHLVTLPDEQGRRSFGQRVRLQPGGKQEIRCNGEVLAKAERPGRLKNDGLARWWVQLD
jgi:hypothetical protein